MTDTSHESQLVVIGASAGGIEALSELVTTLPANFPAPIVVAQHLDPTRISHLEGILSTRSTLPVQSVEKTAKLRAGVIYIVPANRHVEVTDHMVSVSDNYEAGSKPSIDLLFATAAQVYSEGLIAVILTGMGSDGASGARAVKNAGGTVIIQNPETASFPAMPLSLSPTTVDIITNLENIGPLLHDLLSGIHPLPRGDADRQLRAFIEQLREQSGIDFGSYKLPTIMRRLQRRMAATGSNDLADYSRFLQRNTDEYQRLINSFLIKVTEFFRDPDLFEYLRERILPDLITAARTTGELRLWSAGCATGEEAYTLAILVLELLGDNSDLSVRIFATDLDAEAVAFARRGIYPAAALASLPHDLVERYFVPLDGAFEVKKAVRGLVVFGQHDLGQRAPFPRIDLALCRNVLIYFTGELQRRALQLFAFSLRHGGVLVLGKAETVTPLAELFILEHARLKIYRRVGEQVLIPPARIKDSLPLASMKPMVPRRWSGNPDRSVGRLQPETSRPRGIHERLEGLLQRLPIGLVMIDRRFDILTINSEARRLLGVHTAALGDDILRLVQTIPLLTLRETIDRAFRGETIENFQISTTNPTSGEPLCLELGCYGERIVADATLHDTVVIIVTDVTIAVSQRDVLNASLERYRHEASQQAGQVTRLTETNRQLLAANQELTTANQDLRSQNEEMLVSNEESQAATEEIETLNEELQATNEELETLNEELQATVEELNTTNEDLQARSIELQDLAVSLEEQRRASEADRAGLAAILASMGEAVLVVDRNGETVLTNTTYQKLFGDQAWTPLDATGQPLADATPQQRAAAGETFDMHFALAAADGTLEAYEAKGQPVRDETGDVTQGVVVIRKATPK